MSLRRSTVEIDDEGRPSISARQNLFCIQTRYISSYRLQFTSNRRSTPSYLMVNRGGAAQVRWVSAACRDGWITCTDTSSRGTRQNRLRRYLVFAVTMFVIKFGADSCACRGWICAVGDAGEPVNNNASSSAARKKNKAAESRSFFWFTYSKFRMQPLSPRI